MEAKKIKKDELYYFLNEQLGISAYVGIHGTAKCGDIPNEFDQLPKEEKAKNIMNIGLINARKNNLTLTCKFFGLLPLLSQSEDLRKRMKIDDFNRMYYVNGYDNGENGQVMVVAAIPVIFEKSNGNKYFGGWIDNQSSHGHYERPYCFSDLLFAGKIPPECIYGYYTYMHDSDTYVEFHFNPKYYSLLSTEERDSFISDNIENLSKEPLIFARNFSSLTELKKNQQNDNWENFFQNNPYLQFSDYIEFQKHYEGYSNKDVHFYTCEELENIQLCDIDASLIKPSYENIVDGKYSIRSILINQEICGIQLPHFVGLMRDLQSFSVDEFEYEVRKCRNTPENLYKIWYTINKLDFDELYRQNILKMKEEIIRTQHSSSIARATNDLPIESVDEAGKVLDSLSQEQNKEEESFDEPNN